MRERHTERVLARERDTYKGMQRERERERERERVISIS